MGTPLRYARISIKTFAELAVRLRHDQAATELIFNQTVIGYKNADGAFIEPEAYKRLMAS